MLTPPRMPCPKRTRNTVSASVSTSRVQMLPREPISTSRTGCKATPLCTAGISGAGVPSRQGGEMQGAKYPAQKARWERSSRVGQRAVERQETRVESRTVKRQLVSVAPASGTSKVVRAMPPRPVGPRIPVSPPRVFRGSAIAQARGVHQRATGRKAQRLPRRAQAPLFVPCRRNS